MKLNLGSGNDVLNGYVNVDFRDLPGVEKVDLSMFPWKWKNVSVEQVLMLDFFEHFSYRKSKEILDECWRILKEDGELIIQVPDAEQCTRAMVGLSPYYCNYCEKLIDKPIEGSLIWESKCMHCGVDLYKVVQAAVARFYGGSDYFGNFHHTAFTRDSIERLLVESGFDRFEYLEDENDYQRRNWNMKIKALKYKDLWQ